MLKVGDIIVARDPEYIDSYGVSSEGLYEGDEYSILSIDDGFIVVRIDGVVEQFTIEPSETGLSWETFFTVKEL